MHPPTRAAQPPPVEPGGLSEREATIFRDLVRSVDSAHFVESDLPLLTAYAQASAQHERAVMALRREGEVVNGRPSPWIVVQEKAVRAMTALAMRLRLSPQARREQAQAPKRLDWMQRKLLQEEAEE
jgi:phage terminase small subunit